MYAIQIKTYTEFGLLATMHVCPHVFHPDRMTAYHELADAEVKVFPDLEEAKQLATNLGIKLQLPLTAPNPFAPSWLQQPEVFPELFDLCRDILDRQYEMIGDFSKYFNRIKHTVRQNDFDLRKASHLPLHYIGKVPSEMEPRERLEHEVRPVIDHPPVTVIQVVPYVAPLMKPVVVRVG